MINFLVLIGWNPGGEKEIFTTDELIKLFKLEQIQVSGGQYNLEKLDWINHEHLKDLTLEEQEDYIISFIPKKIKKLEKYEENIARKITPL